ncbi:MAG: hypothetical protein CVU81_03300 [Euryarchaeota archaeon HGW-Euryarchaeota-1]|nr:MAG: hypothetical protein CVU81_03300 [Euryarchaeota archaeon HGW-Euryarchaeota-1]
MKRLFVPAKSDIEFSKLSEESLKKLKKHKKIGLITTIQHLHDLDKIKTFFEKQGIQILIGGQVLGCNVENAKKIENEVDVFVYVGSGAFHPLAVAYNTNKPVFVVDYVLNNVLQVSEEARAHYLQKKIIRQEIAKQSNTFGILVSTKPGQENFAAALELKNRLEKQGKMAYLFLGDSISKGILLILTI